MKNTSRRLSRRDTEVVQRAEAAERLAEDAPLLDAQVLAEQLGVLHDRVGTEVGQPSCVGLRVITGGAVRRRAPGPALVQHQHAEVPQRAWQPAGRARHADRPGGLVARAALKEQQVRPVATVGRRDFPSEDLDVSPPRPSWTSGSDTTWSIVIMPWSVVSGVTSPVLVDVGATHGRRSKASTLLHT